MFAWPHMGCMNSSCYTAGVLPLSGDQGANMQEQAPERSKGHSSTHQNPCCLPTMQRTIFVEALKGSQAAARLQRRSVPVASCLCRTERQRTAFTSIRRFCRSMSASLSVSPPSALGRLAWATACKGSREGDLRFPGAAAASAAGGCCSEGLARFGASANWYLQAQPAPSLIYRIYYEKRH